MWSAFLDNVLLITMITALLTVNALGVLLVALQMPGTWLILLATTVAAWWGGLAWDGVMFTYWTLIALLLLAILGEVLEFFAGAAGASKAGASRRGVMGAIVGGVVGAILGTIFLAFIPILGTLIGAALGAGVGSIAGDLWAGRKWGLAFTAGRGAAVGRFWGALWKLVIALMMWTVVVVAIVW